MLFKSKEKKFWNWFERNKHELEVFLNSGLEDYTIYHELSRKIKEYNEFLNPEITGDENNFHFVITPDGIKAGMIPASKLFDSAPEIEGWKFFKYRQPKDEFAIDINGVSLDLESIKILRDFEEEEVDIAFCIRGFEEENQDFKVAGFLMLDHILGEFNVLTRIGSIDFFDWDFLEESHETISLLELRKEIEENLY